MLNNIGNQATKMVNSNGRSIGALVERAWSELDYHKRKKQMYNKVGITCLNGEIEVIKMALISSKQFCERCCEKVPARYRIWSSDMDLKVCIDCAQIALGLVNLDITNQPGPVGSIHVIPISLKELT